MAIDMSLNIKDPEVHRIARAIADETGESMTQVIRGALRDRLAQIDQQKGKASLAELRALSKQVASYAKGPPIDHGEEFYDEFGLPK